jgi:hypothetical protein
VAGGGGICGSCAKLGLTAEKLGREGESSALPSSSANSLAVWKRWLMSRLRALSNQAVNEGGRSGRNSAGRGRGALAICAKVMATPCSVAQTVRPVRHS